MKIKFKQIKFIAICLLNFNIKGNEIMKLKEMEISEVLPVEDLMREHGLLNRVLLIYEEIIKKLNNKEEFDINLLSGAVDVIKNFIEEYHEKLEEDYIFPIFKKAKKLVTLVNTLLEQHKAGRIVTSNIKEILSSENIKTQKIRKKLISLLKKFVRMYRPHEAREDTILFPKLHSLISKQEYEDLGELFEKIEHEKFGENGFEDMVNKVAGIEKKLGIYDLSQFTP